MSLPFTSRLFVRSMLRAFGILKPDSSKEPLIPYFQYKIGAYRRDHFLYFRREPSWLRYKYEAFDKMGRMRGYDIPRFLDFHYAAYSDKEEFRRFLRFELAQRVAELKKHPKYADHEYEVALNWLAEQENLPALTVSPSSAIDDVDSITDILEEKLTEIQRSHAGKIVINGQRQLERFIQLLILVKDLRTPGRGSELLFSSFSTTDMAAILKQFTELRDYKINTLQKKISECNEAMRHDDLVDPLREALTRFFFGDPL